MKEKIYKENLQYNDKFGVDHKIQTHNKFQKL